MEPRFNPPVATTEPPDATAKPPGTPPGGGSQHHDGHQPPPASGPSTHRGTRWVLPLLLALGLGAAVYFLGIRPRVNKNRELAAAAQQAGQASVLVVKPTTATMAPDLNLPGSIQAKQQTSIYSRVNGYLGSWKADIGTQVKAGQLLAQVDAPDTDANVQGARAQLELSEANLGLAKANSARAGALLSQKVISQQEFDTTKATERVSQATRDRDAALLQLQLSYQTYEQITAPFDGTVTARYVDVGALVAVGSATNVQKLFDLAQADPVRVFVNVPQANVSSLVPDAAAVVTVDEYPGKTFPGKVARNAGAFDPASRAMTVEIDLPNPDGQLYPGMYAHAKISVPNPKPALVVANNAILNDAKGARVVSVDGARKIRVKPVQLGRDYGTKTEVLSGLGPDDQIVQNPTDDLTEGLTVATKPAPPPTSK